MLYKIVRKVGCSHWQRKEGREIGVEDALVCYEVLGKDGLGCEVL